MKFKTKVAYSAVLATLSLAAGTAQAAYLSEQGTGQILFYPYYSVQNEMDTYISVVNTTSMGKAVKVRIIEGMASFEVLDFNLYLSAQDVWTASITNSKPAGSIDTVAARIVTTDNSCTVPKIMAPTAPVTGAASESVFRNTLYAGKDQNGDTLDRTREGYVEIIEMGTMKTIGSVGSVGKGDLAWATKHVNGVPNDCAWVVNRWKGISVDATGSEVVAQRPEFELDAPSGGLIGSGTLINVKTGVDYAYDPVAIEDYSNETVLHYAPGSLQPSAKQAKKSSVVIEGGSTVIASDWASGPDAISAVLMRSNVLNEHTQNTDLAAGTDWVVTFPTKHFYVPVNSTLVTAPFSKAAGVKSGPWLACESVAMRRFNREEDEKAAIGIVDFSPQPAAKAGPCLPWESNVISLGTSDVLGSKNVRTQIEDVFSDGWIDLSFNGAQVMADANSGTSHTYTGLPVIGFSVQKYVNNTFNGAVGNYGGSFIHKYLRTIK